MDLVTYLDGLRYLVGPSHFGVADSPLHIRHFTIVILSNLSVHSDRSAFSLLLVIVYLGLGAFGEPFSSNKDIGSAYARVLTRQGVVLRAQRCIHSVYAECK